MFIRSLSKPSYWRGFEIGRITVTSAIISIVFFCVVLGIKVAIEFEIIVSICATFSVGIILHATKSIMPQMHTQPGS